LSSACNIYEITYEIVSDMKKIFNIRGIRDDIQPEPDEDKEESNPSPEHRLEGPVGKDVLGKKNPEMQPEGHECAGENSSKARKVDLMSAKWVKE
jgi:hypothetical protein